MNRLIVSRSLVANRMMASTSLRASRVYKDEMRPRSGESPRVTDSSRFDDEPEPSQDEMISKYLHCLLL